MNPDEQKAWEDPWANPINLALPNSAVVTLVRCTGCKRPRFVGYICEGCRAEAADAALKEKDAQLCRARKAFKYVLEHRGDNTWNHTALCGCDDCKRMQAALSSTDPCAHESKEKEWRHLACEAENKRLDAEEEAKRLREAMEWVCLELKQYAGPGGRMEVLNYVSDELRRRSSP